MTDVEIAAPIFLGIDPGSNGGMAVLQGTSVYMTPMPPSHRDTLDELKYYSSLQHKMPVLATLEEITPGFAGTGKVQMCALYGHFTALRMALWAVGIPFVVVSATDWHRALNISPKGKKESRTRFKNRLADHARSLFPRRRITLATADALLLAEYCRRHFASEVA